jgi:hypothetical protein
LLKETDLLSRDIAALSKEKGRPNAQPVVANANTNANDDSNYSHNNSSNYDAVKALTALREQHEALKRESEDLRELARTQSQAQIEKVNEPHTNSNSNSRKNSNSIHSLESAPVDGVPVTGIDGSLDTVVDNIIKVFVERHEKRSKGSRESANGSNGNVSSASAETVFRPLQRALHDFIDADKRLSPYDVETVLVDLLIAITTAQAEVCVCICVYIYTSHHSSLNFCVHVLKYIALIIVTLILVVQLTPSFLLLTIKYYSLYPWT